jgi:solute carrier family 35 protein C2
MIRDAFDLLMKQLHRAYHLKFIRVAVLIVAWYLIALCLTIFNKLLVGQDSRVFADQKFPAPLFMNATQFFFQWLIVKAVLSTGCIPRTSRGPLSLEEWIRNVLPNGLCTSLDIGFSTMSLVFITLSFYTMCKATVPLFLLAFAFAWGIEKPSWRLGIVVSLISIGLVLMVRGEATFDWAGFSLVMFASFMSGLRFTLTHIFLHGTHGSNKDLQSKGSGPLGGPLEIIEALAPVMSSTMLVLSLIWERLWTLPQSAYFSSLSHISLTLLLIFSGSCLAFLLVSTEYKLIEETSALTFMIAGTCKEVVTVLAAVFILGDSFGWVNGIGLATVMLGVVLYQLHKLERASVDRNSDRSAGEEAGESPTVEMQPLLLEPEPMDVRGAASSASMRQDRGPSPTKAGSERF